MAPASWCPVSSAYPGRVNDEPRDAVEAPPWRPEAGPEPQVTAYLPGHRPLLRVRIDGEWRTATVRARHDYPPGDYPNAGRVAYQVDIRLPAKPGYPDDPRAMETYSRTYWWDPAAMRAVRS